MTKDYKFHFIYKITRNDGKFYIGRHSTNNLNDGYMGSGTYIKRSVTKYGKDAHTLEILYFALNMEDLKVMENTIVNEELLLDELCMNFTVGGAGGRRRNLVNVLKIGDSKRTMVSKEEFYSNRDTYITTNEGKVPVVDVLTGIRCVVDKSIFDASDRYVHFCKDMILVQSGDKLKWISRAEYSTGKYVGANSGRVSGKDNPNAKHIQIFDACGILRFDCVGNFKALCISEQLPHNALRKSHSNGGIPIFMKPRQITFAKKFDMEEFIGWFAKVVG